VSAERKKPAVGAGGSRLTVITTAFRRPLAAEEIHRVTTFEVFFDLVFVFAIIRITTFVTNPLSAETLAEGLLLVLLLWWSWSAFAWVGNQSRADTGLVRAAATVVMAAVFVAGLVIPEAWDSGGAMDPPVVLAVAFVLARLIYLALYLRVTAGGRPIRTLSVLDTLPQVLAICLVLVGAVIGGWTQAALWTAAFAIDFGSGRLSPGLRSYHLRSPSHFAERYGLVLIIALGETLIAVGEGAGHSITHWLVLVAAVLGLLIVVGLWGLYSGCTSPAEHALERVSDRERAIMARDAYTRGHFLLILGALYLAAGVEEVIYHISSGGTEHADAALGWLAALALYGGVAIYLVGRFAFLQLTAGSRRPAPLAGAGLIVLLLPAAASLPALAALGLLSAVVAAVSGFDHFAREQA
jgi:low temperature requirement protein LtrA